MDDVAKGPIIVFDGACVPVLGQCPIRFAARQGRTLRLAAIQSAAGTAFCRRFGIDSADPSTMIVVAGGRALTHRHRHQRVPPDECWPRLEVHPVPRFHRRLRRDSTPRRIRQWRI